MENVSNKVVLSGFAGSDTELKTVGNKLPKQKPLWLKFPYLFFGN